MPGKAYKCWATENELNAIVYNFVDMLSHARTEMEVIRELADDEQAYRSLTLSWFEHSPLHDIVKKCAESGRKLIITTDHGTVRVTNPVKIVGERSTNSNLRYKTGRNLSYKEKRVFKVKNPEDAFLPKIGISSEFVFTREQDYFVYPNNYNHFVNYFNNTFQHGGISMEEMIIPMQIKFALNMDINIDSIQDLPRAAIEFIEAVGHRKIFAFHADMGAGKTTFITAILHAMGIEDVDGSPTYSLVNIYDSQMFGRLNHFDLYRIKNESEALSNAEELLFLHFVLLNGQKKH